jgi:FkbM family methyltransferase
MAAIARLGHYRRKLREKGIAEIIAGRLRWYRQSFQMDNWWVGRMVELSGNIVTVDGVRLSLDNPLIKTRHKSSIYFGIYEVGERALAKRFVDPDLPMIEIGGSIGGVACLTNRMLKNPAAHVVVECNPLVLPTLEKNRALNGCQFTIEPRALAYGADKISFNIAPEHFMMGHLGGDDGEKVTVGTVTLAEIVRTHKFDVINLISDSEGAEVDMVAKEADLLRDRVKTLILETHAAARGEEAIARMIFTLEDIGFQIEHRGKDKLAMINRRLSPA